MLITASAIAQRHLPASITRELKNASNDSLRYVANTRAYLFFEETNRDSALYYVDKILSVAKKNNKPLLIARALASKGYQLTGASRYPEALKTLLQAYAIVNDPKNASNSWYLNPQSTPEKTRLLMLSLTHHMFAILMNRTENAGEMIFHFKEAKKIALQINNSPRVMLADMNLGSAYTDVDRLDSALIYESEARDIALKTGQKKYLGYILGCFGNIALKQGDRVKAKRFYYTGVLSAVEQNNIASEVWNYSSLANLYIAEKQKDSSLYFSLKLLGALKALGSTASQRANIGIAYQNLYRSYELRKQPDSAFKYAQIALLKKDSLYKKRIADLALFQNISFQEQLRLQSLEKEKTLYQSKLRTYGLLIGLIVLLIIALILYRNSLQRKKAYLLLQKQNCEIEAQNAQVQIEIALERVRSKTMAMHSSQDVAETVATMFDELVKLGIEKNVRCGIGIIDDTARIELWTAFINPDGQISLIMGSLDMTIFPMLQSLYNAWKNKEEYFFYEMAGDDLIAYYQAINDAPDYPTRFDIASLPARQFHYDFFFPEGTIFAFSPEPLTPAATQIFKRFAGVFGLTYRRYLDLQKAEAQARDAQIEAALERVRSRTMAMQHSDELRDVIQVIYEQLYQLNFNIDSADFNLDYRYSDDFNLWVGVPGRPYPAKMHIPYIDHPLFNRIVKAKVKVPTVIADCYTSDQKNTYFKHNFKFSPTTIPAERQDFIFGGAGLAISTVLMTNVALSIMNYSGMPYTDADNATLMRFGKVFEQTYTRFKDLEQAEAQAKESQIELALERVRARTMAMQKSDELAETATVLFLQLHNLGISSERTFIGMPNDDTRKIELWGTEQGGNQMNTRFEYEADATYAFREIYKAWQEKRSELTVILKGKNLEEHVNYVRDVLHMPLSVALVQKQRILYNAFFSKGLLMIVTPEVQPEETLNILKRFAAVFDQTYTRFKDLEQAEEQSREAQIQLGLERVRARAMAMQSSGELAEVVDIVFKELTKLDFGLTHCAIAIADAGSVGLTLWQANSEADQPPVSFYRKSFDHPYPNAAYKEWKKRTSKWVYHLKGAEKKAMHDYYASSPETMYVPNAVKEGMAAFDSIILSHSFNNFGYLRTDTTDPLSEGNLDIVYRFAKVFDLCYTRFTDIKQAEAQAKESQIQLGLERVRAKAMAMQTSEELNELIGTVFGELTKLDFVLARCLIMIFDPETNSSRWWMANSEVPAEPMNYLVQNHKNPAYDAYLKAWKERNLKWRYALKGKVKRDWDDFLFVDTELAQLPAPVIEGMKAPEQVLLSASFNNFGSLTLVTHEPLSDEQSEIMLRFAKVFDMSYTRFNDLKQAEAQVREAKIEASLERVRGKAMAMRSSNDLSVTASTVFSELRNLGINPIRSGVGLVTKGTRQARIYSDTSLAKDTDLSLMGEVILSGHPTFELQYQAWLKQENCFAVLGGDELAAYYKILSAGLNADLGGAGKNREKEYGHWFMFSEGFLYAWSDKAYTEAEIKILERFKNVVELTFRRYIELQKSEATARAAVREASLDRVRAEIASMRKRSDLERITPLIWEELIILGIPFIRCGVFIMDEEEKLIHTFLSTPDGKAIGAFHVPFDTSGNFEKMVDSWRHGVPYIDHWEEEAFSQFADTLVKQKAIASKAQYMRTLPHEGIHLNFLPFLQGMLYVGNTTPLSNDEIELVQSLADAFSTAYARYEDFNKLEAAKKVVEETLTDLKAAQTQLIQSEKMASLGELTAGIAHEIQNPLNFVNNFSEVNSELIEEMEDEIGKGNFSEAKAIAADLKQNEQKINMHGKRADSIVKSMLEHSRASSGKKELTDINALAEEYMRLSYHGLRAKDKSFNSAMEVNLDNNLPKASVIPQDIGRVLLNLFNNAFYAVHQKQKTTKVDYKPEVTLTTLTENGQLIIKVKDNGVGMPEHIKEKIMQPFFTTKPTGEGTGLGLSLSYDIIVKGHGGNIEVDSKENEFTIFKVYISA